MSAIDDDVVIPNEVASHSLSWPARLYLLHTALLTTSLAIVGLFFNFTILALGFPLNFLGLINTVSFVVSAVLGLPLLWLLAYLPLRLALASGALIQGFGVLLIAVWPSSTTILIASAALGAGSVLFEMSAAPFMMQHSTAASRDRLFSTNTAIRIGLAGVGSLLAGPLPGILAGWWAVAPQSAAAYRGTFVLAAAGVLVAIVPLLLIRSHVALERPNPTTEQHVFSERKVSAASVSWRALIQNPAPLLKVLLSPALISIGAALLIPYLNLFFQQRFRVPDTMLGFIFAGLGVSTGVAALLAPRLSARVGQMATIVLTEVLAIPFLMLLGVAPVLGIAVGAALVRAALFNMGAPLYDAFAMEHTSEAARPTVMALMSAAYSVGYLWGPLLSTYIQVHYGFAPLFLITTTCYIMAVGIKYWFFLRPRAGIAVIG